MLDCLTGYIGLKACPNQEEPESGIWINSLPGISLESVDKIADSEQVTYAGVWNDVQTEAAIRFKIDFIAELNKCYVLSRDCDYEEMICENLEILTNAWRYLLGNQLMLFRIHSTRLNRFTTVDKEAAEELKDEYQVRYEEALTQAVKLVDTSSCCHQVENNNPQRVLWLP